MRIVDLETVPLATAADYLPAPDLAAIQPAKHLKDPIKVAADLEARQAAAQADYTAALARGGLDWNVGRICAIGITDDGGDTIDVAICTDEAIEKRSLIDFWRTLADQQLCGFCTRTFDVPFLIQRSRYLGVAYPEVSLARYRGTRGDVIDLRDLLTFDDARYEAVMPRSLKAFARRFGVPVADDVNGADVGALVAVGNYAAVEAHVRSDVALTAALCHQIPELRAQLRRAVMEY